MNKTLIIVLPKLEKGGRWEYYRSNSLLKMYYKILAKLLSTQLSSVVTSLFAIDQSNLNAHQKNNHKIQRFYTHIQYS